MRPVHVLTVSAVLATALLAPAPASAEARIAVISTPVLLRDAPQVRAADQKLKGEFEKREKDLQAEGRKLEEDIARFRREADAMSPQQRTGAQNDLNTRKTNFELRQREFSEQAQARNGELQRQVLEQINRAIGEVAREKGIEVVVRDPAYAADGLDITAAVLDKLKTLGNAPAPAEAKKKKKK